MSAENTNQRRIWGALGTICRLFRLNTGTGWVSGGGPVKVLADGTAAVPYGRPIPLGFGGPDGKPVNGPPDLVGWTTVVVTPAMVGRKMAVFTGIEVKRTGGGHKRDSQLNFGEQLQKAGGICGFAETPEQAQEIVRAFIDGRAPDLR